MSDKIRIYELARKLDLDYKDILKEAGELGIEAKSHASSVTEEEAELIEGSLKEQDTVTEAAAAEKKKEPEPEPEKEETPEPADKKPQKEIPHKQDKPEKEVPPQAKGKGTSETVIIAPGISVTELAGKLDMGPAELIEAYSKLGFIVTANQRISIDIAKKVLNGMGYAVKIEDAFRDSDPYERKKIMGRAPVVTVMGHVDHGKTQLLDAIRHTNIVAKESGGITQHIGAYRVELKGQGALTFIDTPGHEAFTAMRARGAQITDIVILVVAADDGVMPQTVEAINHAKAAGVPVIVAINKIDLPEADPEKVRTQLSQHDIITESWGGEVIAVEVSAKEKTNISDLLEMLLLQSELMELKAPVDGPARGVVIESELDKWVGPTATVIITKGTLKTGDSFVCGAVSGKIKAMSDDRGTRIKEAGPSTPVKIMGFDDLTEAGDIFAVVEDRTKARDIAARRQEQLKNSGQAASGKITLEDLRKQLMGEENKELRIILKTDVSGSMEAIKDALLKLETKEVSLDIIHADMGGVSKQDIMLATASNAVIVGFNITAPGTIKKEAEKEGVQIRTYRIIYDIIEDIKKSLEGMLEPEEKEAALGQAEVKQIFNISGQGTVAGSSVVMGVIRRNANARVIRDSRIIYEGKLASLKRFKNDVSEVAQGYECGIKIENFNDIKIGDIVESYQIEKRKRSLEESR